MPTDLRWAESTETPRAGQIRNLKPRIPGFLCQRGSVYHKELLCTGAVLLVLVLSCPRGAQVNDRTLGLTCRSVWGVGRNREGRNSLPISWPPALPVMGLCLEEALGTLLLPVLPNPARAGLQVSEGEKAAPPLGMWGRLTS